MNSTKSIKSIKCLDNGKDQEIMIGILRRKFIFSLLKENFNTFASV